MVGAALGTGSGGDAPLVTVVTVVLDDVAGLRQTAMSVLAQRGVAFEWVVIDGGSTDGTVLAIQALAGRIAHWSSQADEGVYDAMNRGVRAATGQYVSFMNAGDRFADTSSLARLAEETATHRPAMVCGGAISCYPSGIALHRRPRRVATCIRHQAPCSHQAMLTRADLLRAVPFDRRFRIAADYALACRLFVQGERFALTGRTIAVTRQGGTSLSHRQAWRSLCEKWVIQREILGCGRTCSGLSALRRIGATVGEWALSRRMPLRQARKAAWPLPVIPPEGGLG